MVAKTDDSLRSQGLTVIATDKPTRAALKRKAAAEGLPLSQYLRKIAFDEGQPAMLDTGKQSDELDYKNMDNFTFKTALKVARVLNAAGIHPDPVAYANIEAENTRRENLQRRLVPDIG